jgi:hypothetical protein
MEVVVKKGQVIVYAKGATITVEPDRSHGYLVAVNGPGPGPTKVIK